MDYYKTLNIFKSPIEQKAKLVKLTTKIKKYYQEINFDDLIFQISKTRPLYYLLDGPPYANGDIHIGHALNKIIKDIILRYQLLNNKQISYLPGWDCHGLPIEQKVKEKLKTANLDLFFNKSKEYVLEQIKKQKEDFLNLSLLVNFKEYYQTINQSFITNELNLFKILVEKKLIYRDLRPIYWSWSSKTVLSDAEVEYFNKTSDSIYVLFKINNFKYQDENVYFLVWTTTPWSLLGNQALAVNEDFTYSLIKDDKFGYFILNKKLTFHNPIFTHYSFSIIKDLTIKEILKFQYYHLFEDKLYHVYSSKHVIENEGTGIVHVAPGHGEDDFNLGKKHTLNIFSVIDDHGKIHSPNNKFHNLFYEEASKEIIKELEDKNILFLHQKINHSYPHDWRSKKPVVYLVKEQWFIDIEKIKSQIILNIKKLNFFAESGKAKLIKMVKERKSWCVSRQRKWGVPIPVLFDSLNNKAILDLKIISEIINTISKKGILYWFKADIKDLLSNNTYSKLIQKHSKLIKDTDILDVWFDSGTAFLTALAKHKKEILIDLIVEGNDQFRGWFNSSLTLATIWNKNSNHQVKFKNILSHGFVLDAKGHKMSKSLNNIIFPNHFIQEHGVDILRLWTASVDFFVDIRLGNEIIQVIKTDYQKIRNTLRFLITNLTDFDPSKDQTETFEEVDLYILNEFKKLNSDYHQKMKTFTFNSSVKLLKNFLSTTLSAFYLNFVKDIIYIEAPNSLRRRQIQTVFYHLLSALLLFLAPILVNTVEEFYQAFNKLNKKQSIYLEVFANLNFKKYKPVDVRKWNNFFFFRKQLNKALEEAKKQNLIKVWQEAEVIVAFKDKNFYEIKTISNLEQILTIREVKFIKTSEVNDQFIEIDNFYFQIKNQPKIKCLRCWKYFFENEMINDICSSCYKIVNSKQD